MRNTATAGGRWIDVALNRIFVPGGNGFLGKRVTSKLNERGYDVVSLSLRDGYDFRDGARTLELFKDRGFDAVINCAAFVGGIEWGYRRPAELYYNNTLMATNLMEAARLAGVKRFVNPISNCSYPGRLTRDFTEEEWWDGPLHESVMVYGFIRKASWMQSWAYARQYGFETVNLIMPNMYGPGDHFDESRSHALGALIMKFVEAKRRDLPEVVVWGSGAPVREWLYVDDGAEALIRALDVTATTEPVNVGVGKGISVLDLAELIKDAVGYRGKITLDKSRPDGAPYKTMDNTRLKKLFGWAPVTGLREGIDVTINWYLENIAEEGGQS